MILCEDEKLLYNWRFIVLSFLTEAVGPKWHAMSPESMISVESSTFFGAGLIEKSFHFFFFFWTDGGTDVPVFHVAVDGCAGLCLCQCAAVAYAALGGLPGQDLLPVRAEPVRRPRTRRENQGLTSTPRVTT